MDKLRYNDEDFEGFLLDLISSGKLDPMQSGIIKLVIDKGYDALSDKQKRVFDYTVTSNYVDGCQRCGIDIPWCEMLEALDNGGYCNYCQHMMEKIEKE